ncbi:MAG TPA: nitrate/nitrite transporter NrtS [Novimethylophilus sp.]|jgi:hypothetical protein|uniref:nitrate/nitrite transporter NrtS n=1 Tax=Novimethylophilus sp. TaxID=2137426 RepID=UPI002F3FE189
MPPQTSPGFFHLCLTPAIMGHALKVSLVVGSVLNAINQGEAIINGGAELGHFVLNYMVPFCVATYSGAQALRKQQKPLQARGEHARKTD